MQEIITVITILGVITNTITYLFEKRKNEELIGKLEYEICNTKKKLNDIEKKIEDSNLIIDYFESQLIKINIDKNQIQKEKITDLIEYNYDFL